MKIFLGLAILYKLMQGKRVTACALSREFEVSCRTIYRSIDALTCAGFLIVSYSGKNGGYELLSDCNNLKVLNPDDLMDLKMALTFLPQDEKLKALQSKLECLM